MEEFFYRHKKHLFIGGLVVLVILLLITGAEYVYWPVAGEKVMDPAWREIAGPIKVTVSHFEPVEQERTYEDGTVVVWKTVEYVEDDAYEISEDRLQAFLDLLSTSTFRIRKMIKVIEPGDSIGEVRMTIEYPEHNMFCLLGTEGGRKYFNEYRCIASDEWYEQALMLLGKPV